MISPQDPSPSIPTTQKASSNWAALKKKIVPSRTTRKRHYLVKSRKAKDIYKESVGALKAPLNSRLLTNEYDVPKRDLKLAYGLSPRTVTHMTSYSMDTTPGKYLALDCEMVGVGLNAERSALARVSMVNYHGNVLLDTFVKPKERVKDWRTPVSGVGPKNMTEAREFEDVQKEVAELLDGKILVGHALHHDLQALSLSHPRHMTRDTSLHKPFRALANGRIPSLRKVSKAVLGIDIQRGRHSAVEDARAAMSLYRCQKAEFEAVHCKTFYRKKR